MKTKILNYDDFKILFWFTLGYIFSWFNDKSSLFILLVFLYLGLKTGDWIMKKFYKQKKEKK